MIEELKQHIRSLPHEHAIYDFKNGWNNSLRIKLKDREIQKHEVPAKFADSDFAKVVFKRINDEDYNKAPIIEPETIDSDGTIKRSICVDADQLIEDVLHKTFTQFLDDIKRALPNANPNRSKLYQFIAHNKKTIIEKHPKLLVKVRDTHLEKQTLLAIAAQLKSKYQG